MGRGYKGGEERERSRGGKGREEYANKGDGSREREDCNTSKEFPEFNEGRWSLASTERNKQSRSL